MKKGDEIMTSIKGGTSYQTLPTTEQRDDQVKHETKTGGAPAPQKKSGGAHVGPKRTGLQSLRDFSMRFLAAQGNSLNGLVGRLGNPPSQDSGLTTGASHATGIEQRETGNAFGTPTGISGLYTPPGSDPFEMSTPSSRFIDGFVDDLRKNVDERQASARKKLIKRQAEPKCPSQAGLKGIDHPPGVTLEQMLTLEVSELPGNRSVTPIDTSKHVSYPNKFAPFYRFDASGVNDMPAPSIFKGWESIDMFIYYGGTKSEGQILAPSKDWIDAAHRNGKPILGTMNFPTDYDGGEMEDYDTWMSKDASGQYLLAGKFVDWAKRNGFDGWLFSFATPSLQHQREEIPLFFAAMKEYAQSIGFPFKIAAYGGASNGGGTLERQNEMFMGPDSKMIVDVMYIDKFGPSDDQLLDKIERDGIDLKEQIRKRVQTNVLRCQTPGLDSSDEGMAKGPVREDRVGYWIWGADDYDQDELHRWMVDNRDDKKGLSTGAIVGIALASAAAAAAAAAGAYAYRKRRSGEEEEPEVNEAVATLPGNTPKEDNGLPRLPEVPEEGGNLVIDFPEIDDADNTPGSAGA